MGKREQKTRVLLMRKKWWTVGACALAAAVMFLAVHSPAAVGVYAAQRQLPIYCVEKDYKVASLSFDAAWGEVRVRHFSKTLGPKGLMGREMLRFADFILTPVRGL